MDERDRPPLGLVPRQIWLEQRNEEILAALGRYDIAKKNAPKAWLLELLNNDLEIRGIMDIGTSLFLCTLTVCGSVLIALFLKSL